jgi:hypothetical protein
LSNIFLHGRQGLEKSGGNGRRGQAETARKTGREYQFAV